MKESNIAKRANQIEDELGLNLDDVLNKLTQELGEFNDAVQKYRGRYCKTRAQTTDNIKNEVGDLYLNLISVLYRLDVNPNEITNYAANTLEKFEQRKELYKQNLKE